MLTQSHSRFKPAELILQRYRVTGELGQGGMGIVYRCHDEVGGIEVALKALPPEVSHDRAEMEEVRENFRLIEKLHHPNIAAVKTLERDSATGDYFLVLEYVEGVDLREWRRQQPEDKAPLKEAIPILRQVAEALDFAHGRKIIHRDIKPSNVMVTPDGTVKLLDFGIAAQVRTSLARVSQAQFATSGTGPYMAPEQWQGRFQNAASDQYALAVLAYELLDGRLPFEGHDMAVLRAAVLQAPPARLEGLRLPAWRALERGLAKDRAGRHATCLRFVDALSGSSSSRLVLDAFRNFQPRVNRRAFTVTLALLIVLWAGWQFGLKSFRHERAYIAAARKGDLFATYVLRAIYMEKGDWESYSKWVVEGSLMGITNRQEAAGRYAARFAEERKLGETGNAFHMFITACLYQEGIGVTENRFIAFEWYQKCAERGFVPAMSELGRYYELGIGVKSDWEKAVEWYRKAAERGCALGEYGLAACYENGRGVEKRDSAEALKRYLNAANQGLAVAQSVLGDRYEFGGLLVRPDLKEARKWYTRAAKVGWPEAKQALARPGER